MTFTRDRLLGLESFDERVLPAVVLSVPGWGLHGAAVAVAAGVADLAPTLDRIDVSARPVTPPVVAVPHPDTAGSETTIAVIRVPTPAPVSRPALTRDAADIAAAVRVTLADLAAGRADHVATHAPDTGLGPLPGWLAETDGGFRPTDLPEWRVEFRLHPFPALFAAAQDADPVADTVTWADAAPVARALPDAVPPAETPPQVGASDSGAGRMYAAVAEAPVHPAAALPRPNDAGEELATAAPVVMPIAPTPVVLVEAPPPAPLLGLIPVDVSAVEADARALLDRVTDLQSELADGLAGAEEVAWLAGAVVVVGGTTQAVRVYRARGRVGPLPPGSDSVLGQWGATDHDAGG
jgi:hypothetical protein